MARTSEPPPAPTSPEVTGAHAAIDIGTNSFHMVVARPLPEGGFDVVTTEKDMVRLGQGAGEMKELTPAAIERGIRSLKRMKGVADSYGATISATATSAVREALNRNEFLQRAKDEAGVRVEVISGFEEARLIHLGVLQALPVFDRQLLVVDIGGGSTEFLVGRGSEALAARSLKLGSIRLTERFFSKPDPETGDGKMGKKTRKRLKKCRNHVRSALAATAHELGSLGHEVAIGSSGTITAIATMIAVAKGERVDRVNGLTFTAEELTDLVGLIASTPLEERNDIPGIDERRADIVLAGAVLLEMIFESFEVESMTVSAYALREGLLFDRMSKQNLDSDGRLIDLRRSNVERLALALDPDAAHAKTSARLAVELFDQTTDLHGFGPAERELLELAALVANVGLSISHAAHHKHSYYVVRHSEILTGFSERERELLALIARYHRKGHPAVKHPEFAALSGRDRRRVRVLAGLLRVAIGLDRGHTGVVDGVQAVVDESADDGVLKLTAVSAAADAGRDINLELYSAQERSGLLAEALDVPILVEGTEVLELVD